MGRPPKLGVSEPCLLISGALLSFSTQITCRGKVEDRPSARDRMRITWRGTCKSAGPVAGIGTACELMNGCASGHGVVWVTSL